MDLLEQLQNDTDGVVELVVEDVKDGEIVWVEYDTTTPRDMLNNDLPALSQGDLVQFDTTTGTFTLIG